MNKYVSRAGEKISFALKKFNIDVSDFICADFGCSTGGFTDSLLQNGAKKVYAIDTGYGVLDWKLRNDERVVVMERTNALRVEIDEKMDLITIDTSWTRQRNIIPKALELLKKGGIILSLVKPHYEADKKLLIKGTLPDIHHQAVLENVQNEINQYKVDFCGLTKSPIVGKSGKNVEYILFLKKK